MAHYLRVTDRISPKLGAFFPAGNKVIAKKFSPLTLENLREIKNESMQNILCERRSQLEVSRHVFVPTDQLVGSLKQVNDSTEVWFENSDSPMSFEYAMTSLGSFLKQGGTSVSFELWITRRAETISPGDPLNLNITRKRFNGQFSDTMRLDLPSLYFAGEVNPFLGVKPASHILYCFPSYFPLGSTREAGFASGMIHKFI